MATSKDIPRSGISFEEFVEAATSAAVRASVRASEEAAKATGRPGDYRPWPIWIGLIIRDPESIQAVGNVNVNAKQ
jgi:hypothetical protein